MSKNYEDMSDDEILNLSETDHGVLGDAEVSADPEDANDQLHTEQEDGSVAVEDDNPIVEDEGAPQTDPNVGTGSNDEPAPVDGEQPAGETAPVEEDELTRFKSEREKIFSKFRANGRDMQARDADEVVRLMQQGANYAKKMMTIKPALKTVEMLKKNDLLDEEKLSFLIDLQKGDRAAISKFLKEKGIDPLDIDLDQETAYKPNNYAVSDAEMEFQSVLADVAATPTGKETITHVDSTWDAQSKEILASTPSLLKNIDEQRANGVYALISDEVERQRMLGNISDNTPFITAYEQVGRMLMQQRNQMQQSVQSAPQVVTAPAPQPAPLGRRVGSQVNQPIQNPAADAKLRAAAPSRGTGHRQKQTISDEDLFNIPDDDFMKTFNGRL